MSIKLKKINKLLFVLNDLKQQQQKKMRKLQDHLDRPLLIRPWL